MSAEAVIVCAFDPVAELGGRQGVFTVPAPLAQRLIREHRVEAVVGRVSDELRFVPGSAAFLAAGRALREAREGDAPPSGARARKGAKAET